MKKGCPLLSVYYGDMPEAIYNTAMYFKNVYAEEWFDDPFVRRMVKGVDKAEVLDSRLIRSKVLGLIPPVDLSGGVKTLILVYEMPEKVFNASTCGDNCAKWLLEISKRREVTVNLRHMMDFGDKPFDLHILNNGETVHSMAELSLVAGGFLGVDHA